jgi:hypothetical protein
MGMIAPPGAEVKEKVLDIQSLEKEDDSQYIIIKYPRRFEYETEKVDFDPTGSGACADDGWL